MHRSLALALFFALVFGHSTAGAHGGYFRDISTLTVSTHYLTSEDGSDGSVGIGYRTGFLGLIGFCVLSDLEYRFDRAAVDTKLGFDAWVAFWGIRTDVLVRHYVPDERTRVGASLGAEMIVAPDMILYAGANLLSGEAAEGVFGLTWMFHGL